MNMLCRILGHKASQRVSGATGDLRTRCVRCGANLMMFERGRWRSVDLSRRRRTVRAFLAQLKRRLACRAGQHIASLGAAPEWVNDVTGDGFHVSRCRECGVRIARRPGGTWCAVRHKG